MHTRETLAEDARQTRFQPLGRRPVDRGNADSAGTRRRVAEAAIRQDSLDLGYRFLNMGADVIALSRCCADRAKSCGTNAKDIGGQYGQREK